MAAQEGNLVNLPTSHYCRTKGTLLAACFVILAALAACGRGHCAIWGIKSHDPTTAPPVTLFHFADNGTAFNSVGVVKLGGQEIDVDGLAMTPGADLFAFKVTGASSTMVKISNSTGTAYGPGPELPGVDIRGAVFCLSGKLACLDALGNRMVFVDPATGELMGPGVALTLDGQPFDIPDYTDAAQSPDGVMYIASQGNVLYTMDPLTGAVTRAFTDTTPTPDGYVLTIAGLTFSRLSSLANTMFVYDVSKQDDILSYDTSAAFARSLLFQNIIPSYNAGRGDLAAQLDPPVAYRVTNRTADDLVTKRGSFLHRYIVWGRVGSPGADGFTLDDGSGAPVFVKTNAAAAVSEGDYAEAEGVLHYSDSGTILLSSPTDVTVLAEAEGGAM